MPHPLFRISKASLQGMMWLIWLVRLALIGGLLFALIAVFAFSCRSGKPPPITEAPYSVVAVIEDNIGGQQPLIHVYYAKNVLDKGFEYIMLDWWQFDGKHYNLNKGEKPLIKKDWNRIGVYKR